MGVIDKFIIMFKALGAAEVIAEEKKMEKATDALEKKVSGVDKALKSVGGELVAIGKNLAGAAAAAVSAAAIFGSLKAAVTNIQDLSKLSNVLGVDISTLDAWDKAITKAGGDAGTFNASVKSLAENLGTSPRVALQALLPLADAFSRLGRFRALQYGKKLGLDEATILMLQRGRRAVQGLIQDQYNLGVVTKRDQEVTDAYTRSLSDAQNAFGSMARAVAVEVLPTLTKFFNLMVTPAFEYLTAHKDLVVGALLAIGAAATVAAAPFVPMLATILAVTAALAALALAYEDVKFYFEGKESLTGRIIDSVTAPNSLSKQYAEPKTQRTLDSIFKGKQIIDTASTSGIGSTSSSSILNSTRGGDKNTNVDINEITINTQATDAGEIRNELLKGFSGQYWHANNQFATGTAY